jgi:cytochrome bd-type quinol oxidase subunit 2
MYLLSVAQEQPDSHRALPLLIVRTLLTVYTLRTVCTLLAVYTLLGIVWLQVHADHMLSRRPHPFFPPI